MKLIETNIDRNAKLAQCMQEHEFKLNSLTPNHLQQKSWERSEMINKMNERSPLRGGLIGADRKEIQYRQNTEFQIGDSEGNYQKKQKQQQLICSMLLKSQIELKSKKKMEIKTKEIEFSNKVKEDIQVQSEVELQSKIDRKNRIMTEFVKGNQKLIQVRQNFANVKY